MSKQYPRGQHFVKKTFHNFFTADTIKWFVERGVNLKTENDGRMFPVTDSSQTIIDCLMNEVNCYNVEILLKTEVRSLKPEAGKFRIELSDFRSLASDFVCIASGGFSKSSMFDWLKELGHTIEDPVPSLYTFNLPAHPITKLMGVSVEDVKVKIQGSKLEQQGPLLITHWGLSGPAILKLSAWGARELKERNWEFGIIVNWLPDFNEQELKEKFQQLRFEIATQKISGKNRFGLPQRLWEFLLDHSDVNICNCEFNIKGKTTFKEEFVTAGGIKINEIDANTMMSKKVPNLFFAGEVLDVDGITGGFNFQHAWTSGWVAAKSIAGISK
jgi:predicted Rossmann fold flavoprotein